MICGSHLSINNKIVILHYIVNYNGKLWKSWIFSIIVNKNSFYLASEAYLGSTYAHATPVREEFVSSEVKRLQTPLHDVSMSLWEEQCF